MIGALPVGAGPRAIGFANKLAYLASYDGQSIAILQEPVMPRSLTPRLLDRPDQGIVIEFDAPIVTSTVKFDITPTIRTTYPLNNSGTAGRAPMPGSERRGSRPRFFEMIPHDHHVDADRDAGDFNSRRRRARAL